MRLRSQGKALASMILDSRIGQAPLTQGAPYIETRGCSYFLQVKNTKKPTSCITTVTTALRREPKLPDGHQISTTASQFDSLFDDTEEETSRWASREREDTEMVDRWIETADQWKGDISVIDSGTSQTHTDQPQDQSSNRDDLFRPPPAVSISQSEIGTSQQSTNTLPSGEYLHPSSSSCRHPSPLPTHLRHQPSPLEQIHLQEFLPTHIQDFLVSNQNPLQSPYTFHENASKPAAREKLLPSTILSTDPDNIVPQPTDQYMLVLPTGENDPEAKRSFPLEDVVFHGPAPERQKTNPPTQYVTLFANGTWAWYFRKVTFNPGDIVEDTDHFFVHDEQNKAEWEVLMTTFEKGGKEWVEIKRVEDRLLDRKEAGELWNFHALFAERYRDGIPTDDDDDDDIDGGVNFEGVDMDLDDDIETIVID